MRESIDISSRAIVEVRRSFEEGGESLADYRLRVGANKGGCSGWRWELESEKKSESNETDIIFKFNDLEIIIDQKILNSVIGPAQIHYTSQNIVEQGFTFIRKNGQACGCGESLTAISDL